MEMQQKNYQSIAPAAKIVWRINAALFCTVLFSATLFIYFIIFKHLWIFAILALIGTLIIVILPAIEYRQWKYFIGDDRIEIIHGIFFIKRTVIPINRIQHMKIRQGVIQKQFKLSSVDIYTAGGAHQIEALSYAEAETIVNHLNLTVVACAKPPEPTSDSAGESAGNQDAT